MKSTAVPMSLTAVWPVTIGELASGLSAISAGRVDLP
jgi:hypothetical protein